MRKSNLNKTSVSGRLHSFGDNGKNVLKVGVSGERSKNPGTEYISGIMNIAVDEEGMNVIPVRFTYMTANYGNNKANPNFNILKNIIETGKTWVEHGKDGATLIKVDGSIDLNEFYTKEGDKEILVSNKVNAGSFVTILTSLPEDELERVNFECDMFITRATRVEADEEKGIAEDYLTLGGAIFNYKNEIKPVEFIVRNPLGMAYFESVELPIFTKITNGSIVNATITKETTEESAWGGDVVKKTSRKVREWVVQRCARAPYEYGDPEVLTAEDITACMQAREVALAEMKKRSDDYQAQKAAPAPAPAATVTPNKGSFVF